MYFQVCVNGNNDYIAWGVNQFGRVFEFKHGYWKWVLAWLKQITCGEAGIWGINTFGNLYIYENQRWAKTETNGNIFKWISSGLKGELWAVDRDDNVFRRRDNLDGAEWSQVPGQKLKQVDVFNGIVWGVDKNNHIWFRTTTD